MWLPLAGVVNAGWKVQRAAENPDEAAGWNAKYGAIEARHTTPQAPLVWLRVAEKDRTRGDHRGHRGLDRFCDGVSGMKPSRTLGPPSLKRPWMAFQA